MDKSASTDLLIELLPANRIATRPWLLKNGLSKDRLDNYVKSGRLRKLARGVFCPRHALLNWQSVAASLGESIPVTAYVGGLSALQEGGYAQYLNLGKTRTIALYSPSPKPYWLKEVSAHLDGVAFSWHKVQRLWPELALSFLLLPSPLPSTLPSLKDQQGISRSYSGDKLMLASPERAFIELLDEVPKQISFEHADEIMQGLLNLSPRKLEPLLNSCNSVKAKRLFCWFADRHQHNWWNKFDYRQFDLGAGKRVLQSGGRLDSRYHITVPARMFNDYLAEADTL